VRLAPHAELLEHARRGRVARFEAAGDAVQAVVLERMVEQRARRLGRVAAAVVGGVEDEADLALAVLGIDAHGEVADQLAGLAQLDRERRAGLRRPGEDPLDPRPRLLLGGRVPVQPAHDVLARADGVQRGVVVSAQRAEREPLGLDQRITWVA